MHFPFNLEKAIQAAGVILSERHSHTMELLRLLKLLYIVERETIAEIGHPIIGSRLVAMRNGPLHSELYDIIKQECSQAARWSEFFVKDGYRIHRKKDPGVDRLSRFEVRKLTEVGQRYSAIDTWALVEETHEFPEWKKNYPNPAESTSRAISSRDLLEAMGQGDLADAFEEQAREATAMEQLLR